jgi:hypothetical protein
MLPDTDPPSASPQRLTIAIVVGFCFAIFSPFLDRVVRDVLLRDILDARPQPAWDGGATELLFHEIHQDKEGNFRPTNSDEGWDEYNVRFVMLRDLPSLVEARDSDPLYMSEYKRTLGHNADEEVTRRFFQREANNEYRYYGTGYYGWGDFQPGHQERADNGELVYVEQRYLWRGGIYLRGGPHVDGLDGAFRRLHGVVWHDYDVELFTHGLLLVGFCIGVWRLGAVPTWFAAVASLYVIVLSLFMYFSTVVVERGHPLFWISDLFVPVAATIFATFRWERARPKFVRTSSHSLPSTVLLPEPVRPLDRSAEVLEQAARRMPPSPESARLFKAAQALRAADSIRILKGDLGADFDDPAIQKALHDAGIRLD